MQDVDLTSCDREPIHIPGSIQSHGFLVAVQKDTYLIKKVSSNVGDYIGTTAAALIDQPIQHLDSFIASTVPGSALEELLNVGRRNQSYESLSPQQMQVADQDMNLIIHASGEYIVLEFEPRLTWMDVLDYQKLITRSLQEVQGAPTLQLLLDRAAKWVKSITGFDRVMVYQFMEDWHGVVVAEQKESHLEAFLGLHYPASDIPKQARQLYLRNLVRLIADVSSTSARLYPDEKPGSDILDLSDSVLRSVSPIHIEYLKNMGVMASMSISLVINGKLWGLIACHHYSPRFVDYPARTTARFISQILSATLEHHRGETDSEFANQVLSTGQQLLIQMTKDWDVAEGLVGRKDTILQLTKASGAALVFENKVYLLGTTPTEEEVRALVKWLGTLQVDNFFQTDHLPNQYSPALAYKDKASGLMVVGLSPILEEYVLWFKPEQIQLVSWAGNPEKSVSGHEEDGTIRLSPRKSFEKWTQEVKNTSLPWEDVEIAGALRLREDILHVITRKANEIRRLNEQLKHAYEELDAFSYTISHDLRTPLTTLKSYTEILLEDFGEELDEEARQIIDRILRSADRMGLLIQNVLGYSRLSRSEINRQEIPMRPVIDTLLEDLRVAITTHQPSVQIGTTPPLYGDPTMIGQIFANVISNAFKYSVSAKEPRIEINGKVEGEEVIYAVRDNGIGINMGQASKVFDLFKRLDNTGSIEGNGVGMAIAKRIVNRHNGRIWFQSKEGEGTIFYVALPVKKPAEVPANSN
ncbi:ATP-binding protein [Telluribacter sp.]|jgi:light-regulated signal transduction histidine kinase (bacteriophytochrome)|uniref:ATP-binding protein n=1 Tax=Telluribacter sp. TaxID=1978767 RepID=UPI002E0D7009|nr:ATP-binding protein [Telluribacter sp.]